MYFAKCFQVVCFKLVFENIGQRGKRRYQWKNKWRVCVCVGKCVLKLVDIMSVNVNKREVSIIYTRE
jgi:hypothetical protein